MAEVGIAKTFLKSASALDGSDRARAFDFMTRFHEAPEAQGRNFETIQSARGSNLFSARINQGLRAVIHREGDRYTLLYAGPHDDAYDWAERRGVGHHPVTGILQIVEAVEEVERRIKPVAEEDRAPGLFPAARFEDAYLLSLGVPEDWLPLLRRLSTEDDLLTAAEKLPEEVAERLLALASGEMVTPPPPVSRTTPLAQSPDNLRRFWVLQEGDDLAEWLNKPFDTWIRFLHPSQRELVHKRWNGPVKVTGSAGTGKTVVAMHRARQLAKEGKRVLLTSFVATLCRNVERNLQLLCSAEEIGRIQVSTVHALALSMVREVVGRACPVNSDEVRERIEQVRKPTAPELDTEFLTREWDQVVQPLGVADWEIYRDVERRGRGRPLSVRERQRVWEVLGRVRADLDAENRFTWPGLCHRARELLETGRVAVPFDAVIVDEVQDLKPAEIRFLVAVAEKGGVLSDLMLLGDAGQRIYPGGFSLRSLGIDVRGRSRVLRINYRTTEQIRRAADQLLGDRSDDLDGESERRDLTRSLLRGPEPTLRGFRSESDELAFVAERIQEVLAQGVQPGDVAVFARILRLLEPVQARLAELKLPSQYLADEGAGLGSGVSLGSMHRAKGLEFRIVFVIGCNEGLVPLRTALRRREGPDLEEAQDLERSLLYVSLTRARDEAFVTWHGRPSPFLGALLSGKEAGA